MSTAIQLIYDALNLSEVSSLQFDTPDNVQTSVGLRLLNGILKEASIDASMIIYKKSYDFNSSPGEAGYIVPDLIQLETLTFFLPSNVRFEMIQDSTYHFWGTCRAEDIQSLPSHYYVQRQLGGTKILLYFIPDQSYPMQIFGKFAYSNVKINDDLDIFYDNFYQKYLKYELANELAQQYNIQLNPAVEKKLAILKDGISMITTIDLTVRKTQLTDRKNSPGYWGFVNYSRGWTP